MENENVFYVAVEGMSNDVNDFGDLIKPIPPPPPPPSQQQSSQSTMSGIYNELLPSIMGIPCIDGSVENVIVYHHPVPLGQGRKITAPCTVTCPFPITAAHLASAAAMAAAMKNKSSCDVGGGTADGPKKPIIIEKSVSSTSHPIGRKRSPVSSPGTPLSLDFEDLASPKSSSESADLRVIPSASSGNESPPASPGYSPLLESDLELPEPRSPSAASSSSQACFLGLANPVDVIPPPPTRAILSPNTNNDEDHDNLEIPIIPAPPPPPPPRLPTPGIISDGMVKKGKRGRKPRDRSGLSNQCSECGEECKDVMACQRHMKVHSGPNATLVCFDDPENCSAKFNNKTSLTKHRQKAHGHTVHRDQTIEGKEKLKQAKEAKLEEQQRRMMLELRNQSY